MTQLPCGAGGAAYKVYREFRTSRRPLNVAFVRAGLPEQETYMPPLRRHTGAAHKLSPGIQKI